MTSFYILHPALIIKWNFLAKVVLVVAYVNLTVPL